MAEACACGRGGAKPFEYLRGGELVFAADVCDDCLAEADVGLSILRGEKHELLDRGVHPQIVERIMQRRVEEGADQSPRGPVRRD